jgi:hypothetical protein
MAGIPKEGKFVEIGHERDQLAGPVSLLRTVINNQGPGRNKSSGKENVCPASRKDLYEIPTQRACRELEFNEKIATDRPSLALGLWFAARISMRESPGRRVPRWF